MRLYKINPDVEFPEKLEAGYMNIRSAERIDVRPNEARLVSTGLRLSKTKDEVITVKDLWGTEYILENSGEELFIKVTNGGIRNIMIYVGMVIGEVTAEK